MKASPTKLTLDRLRKEGWTAAVVEKWNPHAKIRQDLFGFIDVLAINGRFTLGVQATTSANHAARVKKSTQHPNYEAWMGGNSRDFEVWSWKKVGHRWQVRKE